MNWKVYWLLMLGAAVLTAVRTAVTGGSWRWWAVGLAGAAVVAAAVAWGASRLLDRYADRYGGDL